MRLARTLILLLVASVSLAAGAAAESIRIASFNIAQFGEGTLPERRDLAAIAKMLTDADLDLVRIQEVGTKEGGATQVAALATQMNATSAGGSEYFSEVSPVSGDERYAVIYRWPVFQEGEYLWQEEDKDPDRPQEGGKVYAHIPVAIPFQAGDLDFYVVLMHLTAGDKTRRGREIRALRSFLRADPSDEGDWIVLGDMNRYLGYSESSDDKAFDQLIAGRWDDYYRFPPLEAITPSTAGDDDLSGRMKVFRAPDDERSTTISKKNDVFDQFILTEGAFREFGTEDPMLGTQVGIIPFDMDPPYDGISDHNAVKFEISDHRPIWIAMQIDLGDDD